MKYILGALIISFGFLFVGVSILMFLDIKIANGGMKYLGLAWFVLALASYPLARRVVRA